MGILMVILLTLALLVCNLIYCGQRIMADFRQSPRANVTLGSFAFCGAVMSTVSMVWATLASLAHL